MHGKHTGSGNSSEPPVLSSTSNNHSQVLLTREALAARWSVSLRTVDRLRQNGHLPWVDINGGRGRKPLVRFCLADVESYEKTARMDCRGVDS
jgi:hypothetical protein